jgi:hypothetical protein
MRIRLKTTYSRKKICFAHLSRFVVFHDELKGSQKILLKVEVLQLALLQKLEGQLPESE